MILKRRLLRSLLTAVVLLGGAGLTIRPASAIELFRFNLQGTYGLSWYGADYSVSPNSTFALVGVLSLDGLGGITKGSISYNDAGTVCEGLIVAASKAYSVLPDGEGDLDINIALKSGTCPITEFDFPISISSVGGSKVARRVSSGAGQNLAANLTGSGLAILQSRKPVTLSDGGLHNGYSFSWFGHDFLTTASPNNGFGAVGAIGFSRNGTVLGGSIAYNDGGMVCRAGGLSGKDGLSGAGLAGTYTVHNDGEAVINLEIVGAQDPATCPLTSFVMDAALSDVQSSGTAGRIQFLSASAAGPNNPGSPNVVISGEAIKVGRFVLNK